MLHNLTVTTEACGVASLPGSSVGPADGVVGAVALDTQAAVLSAR